MKDFLKKIKDKLKEYRGVILMYLSMLLISIISDIFFGGFNLIKYIVYSILFIILVIIMIVYKDKIIEELDKVDESINDAIDKLKKK